MDEAEFTEWVAGCQHQLLRAWDVETGDVRRIAQTTNNWNAFSLAVG